MRPKHEVLIRSLILSALLFGWAARAFSQGVPALTFDLKKPQKFENKKLGSEKTAEKKFTIPRRIIQNTVTKYNWHFNANEKLNAVIERAKLANKDDYTKLLSFYNYSLDKTAQDKTDLDSVIYKANAGILLHDLRNAWVDNLYMLMGRAYYLRKEFDTAYLTFQYINYAFSPKEKDGYDKVIGSNANEGGSAFSIATPEKKTLPAKLFSTPPSRNESFIWQIRTYLAMDEFPEAAGLIETLKRDPMFPARLQNDLHEVQALWFYKQEMYDSAATHLEQALGVAANKQEQARWEYLIAQLYERTGKTEMAREFYDRTIRHSIDPVLEVYARLNYIRQNKGDEKAIQQNIALLVKMAGKDRYINYRDIIYYTIAEIELERNDVAAARQFLLKATQTGIRAGGDPNQQSKAFLLLGDLSFQEGLYADAKRFYDSVSNPEIVPDIEKFTARKSVLGGMSQQFAIIYRQDSLQRIAAMPEAEREAFIRKLVKRLRKQQGLKEDETPGNNNQPLNNNNSAPVDLFNNPADKGEFYFYNNALKSKGYSEFKSKWGNRPNVDNWRRVQAVNLAVAASQVDVNKGLLHVDAAGNNEISYDALVKNLPLTPSQLQVSDDSIQNAQADLGKALMEGLEDYPAAIKIFEEFREKAPYSSRRAEVLFNLYYCYKKTGNAAKAEEILAELKTAYAGTEYEKKITHPDSVANASVATPAMTRQYEKIYNLFIEGNFAEALAEKKLADSLYGNNYWTPQLLYIQSIYYVRQHQDDSAKQVLNELSRLYPQSPLAEKAKTMLDVLNRRNEIETYLTQLQIQRPADDTTALTITNKPPVVQRVIVQVPTTVRDSVLQGAAKNEPKTNKPGPPPKAVFVRDTVAQQFVVIVLDKVDPVFVTEAKNAFNRYNKQAYYNKTIDIAGEEVSDSVKLVVMSNFENMATALEYLEKTRKIASDEIVPWLPAGKFSFIVITRQNLDILENTKDLETYQKFLAQLFPGKF